MDQLSIKTPYDNQEKIVRILLPKGYHETTETFPVLYMHDGQNLFHKNESFSQSIWEVEEALKDEKIILVALNHSSKRIQEYIPFKSRYLNIGENYGEQYVDWIVQSLKPFVDQTYRTKVERDSTIIAGSSLGALSSAYAITRYNEVFGIAGIFSLALLHYEASLFSLMDEFPMHEDTKIFLQVGTHEVIDWKKKKLRKKASQSYLNKTLHYYKQLLKNGLSVNNIDLNIDIDAKHHEEAWRKAFPKFVKFLKQND